MEWPYIAPRVEFVLQGFANEKHLFVFQQTPMKVTTKTGTEEIDWAKCAKCGTDVWPEIESLRDHGRLHLAVDLAKRSAA